MVVIGVSSNFLQKAKHRIIVSASSSCTFRLLGPFSRAPDWALRMAVIRREIKRVTLSTPSDFPKA
jgi:hypothetical protein